MIISKVPTVLGFYVKQCTNAQMTNRQHVENHIVYLQLLKKMLHFVGILLPKRFVILLH